MFVLMRSTELLLWNLKQKDKTRRRDFGMNTSVQCTGHESTSGFFILLILPPLSLSPSEKKKERNVSRFESRRARHCRKLPYNYNCCCCCCSLHSYDFEERIKRGRRVFTTHLPQFWKKSFTRKFRKLKKEKLRQRIKKSLHSLTVRKLVPL